MDTPSFSNEADSAWEGSDDNNAGFGSSGSSDHVYGVTSGRSGVGYNNSASNLDFGAGQTLLREGEPDFPPKPV